MPASLLELVLQNVKGTKRREIMTNRQIKDIVPKAWAAAIRNAALRAA
jgi:hypothetical protein